MKLSIAKKPQIDVDLYKMSPIVNFIIIYFTLKIVTSERLMNINNLPNIFKLSETVTPKPYIHHVKGRRPQNIHEMTELPPRYSVMKSGKIISLEWEKDKYNNNVYSGAFDALLARNRYKRL